METFSHRRRRYRMARWGLLCATAAVCISRTTGFSGANVGIQLGRTLKAEEIVMQCFPDSQCMGALEGQIEGSNDYRVFVTRSTDFGRTWTPATTLENQQRGKLPRLSCVFAPQQQQKYCVVAFSDSNDDNVFISQSTDGGLSWTTATRLNLDSGQHGKLIQPDVVCFLPAGKTDGNAIVCNLLVLGSEPKRKVMALRSQDGGKTFVLNPNILATEELGVEPDPPRLACTENGGLCLAAFSGFDFENGNKLESKSVRWVKSVDGGATFSPFQKLNRSQKQTQAAQPNGSPRTVNPVVSCVADGSSCVIVAESFVRNGNSDNNRWIESAYSNDNSATWSSFQVIYAPANVQITADEASVSCLGRQTCVAVWELDNAPNDQQAPMFSITKNGGREWAVAAPFQGHPGYISDDVEVECVTGLGCVSGWEAQGAPGGEESITVFFSHLEVETLPLVPSLAPTSAPTNASSVVNPPGGNDTVNADIQNGQGKKDDTLEIVFISLGAVLGAVLLGFCCFFVGRMRSQKHGGSSAGSLAGFPIKSVVSRWSSSTESFNSSALSSFSSSSSPSQSPASSAASVSPTPLGAGNVRPERNRMFNSISSRSSRFSSVIFRFVPARFTSVRSVASRYNGNVPEV